MDEQIDKIMKLVQANSVVAKVYHQIFELERMAPRPQPPKSANEPPSPHPNSAGEFTARGGSKANALPVFVQLIHNTVNDQLSLLLIPNFAQFLTDSQVLLENIIEVKLDKDLAANDSNFVLLQERYGVRDQSSMMVTNVATLFLSAEFRTLLCNILHHLF